MEPEKLEQLRAALEKSLMLAVQEYVSHGGRLSDLDWFSYRQLRERLDARQNLE